MSLEHPEHFFHLQYVVLPCTEKSDLKMSMKMGDASDKFSELSATPCVPVVARPGHPFPQHTTFGAGTDTRVDSAHIRNSRIEKVDSNLFIY